MIEVKLKFGMPGVLSLERYEQVVASNFDTLMDDNNEKKSVSVIEFNVSTNRNVPTLRRQIN